MKSTREKLAVLALCIASGSALAGQDVAPVDNQDYAKECGSCHFPYQPGLMPARSWEKLMANLADHFGDNAELPAGEQKMLTEYLVANAADKSKFKRSVKIMKSVAAGQTPTRITEIRYIVDKHDEVPKRLIVDNPEVKSLSRCDACHIKAAEGSYSEGEIKIPGAGRWEDD